LKAVGCSQVQGRRARTHFCIYISTVRQQDVDNASEAISRSGVQRCFTILGRELGLRAAVEEQFNKRFMAVAKRAARS
jgi:hypothetical protein